MKKNFHEEDRVPYYNAADKNDRLVTNFWDINHTMRFLYEGRGSQKRILIILLKVGSITQSRLTERLGIQPGSASEVLAKLEKSGLIVRTESPDDRRTTEITLTDQGRMLAEEAVRQRSLRQAEMFACLTEEEKSTLLALLEKVNDSWQERYRSMEGSSCGRHGGGRHYHDSKEQ